MARKKIQLEEVNLLPTIVKGSHLTVTTYPNGKTELEWDWDALVQEVRMALLKAESNIPANTELANMKPAVKAKSKKSVVKTK